MLHLEILEKASYWAGLLMSQSSQYHRCQLICSNVMVQIPKIEYLKVPFSVGKTSEVSVDKMRPPIKSAPFDFSHVSSYFLPSGLGNVCLFVCLFSMWSVQQLHGPRQWLFLHCISPLSCFPLFSDSWPGTTSACGRDRDRLLPLCLHILYSSLIPTVLLHQISAVGSRLLQSFKLMLPEASDYLWLHSLNLRYLFLYFSVLHLTLHGSCLHGMNILCQ